LRIAVVGAGLMGPTIAMDCVENEEVDEVLLIDVDMVSLGKAAESLGLPSKLKTLVQDVTDREGLVNSLKGYDVACIALSKWLNVEATWGAIEAAVNVVDLSEPARRDWERINNAARKAAVTVIPGCGLEPGLTEMLAAYGMDMLDSINAVNIWCGGIPQDPQPPLDYKIVYGGPYLPLQPGGVKIIEDGEVREARRYAQSGPVRFEGVEKALECYFDRFPETLYEIEKFEGVKECANRTVRYAGYCDKVKFLEECGLLSREAVEFKDRNIIPFEIFSKIIYPKVRMNEGEKDITVLRVIVEGIKEGGEACHVFDMVDFYDENRSITSMARTTSYTAAIVARMLGRGDISEKGLVPPARIIRGNFFHKLLKELDKNGVKVTETLTTRSYL